MLFLFSSVLLLRLSSSEYSHTIRLVEPVRRDRQRARRRIESVDLRWQAGERTEGLKIAVLGIREVEVAVARVDRDIVEGVELAAVVIVYEH